MKKLLCMLACLLLALCCCGAMAEDNVCHCEDWGDFSFHYDADGHWIVCANCGKIPYENQGPHENSCFSQNRCVVCDMSYSSGTYWHVPGNGYITDANSHWYVCSVCGETTAPEAHQRYCYLTITGCMYCDAACEPTHTWEVTSETEATCGAAGSAVYTCFYCDETKTEATPATGAHDWMNVGAHANECANCGELCWHSLDPRNGYQYDENCHWQICPNCGLIANSSYSPHISSCTSPNSCSVCEAPYPGNNQDDIYYHSIGGVQYSTDEANHWLVCILCNEIVGLEAHYADCASSTVCEGCGSEFDPHSWEITSETEATCTTNSEVVYTCSVCGKTHSEVHELATGHQWEYNTDGWRGICADCGEICEHYNRDFETPYQYDAERHWRLCADCGLRAPENYAPHENMCYSRDACWLCGAPYSSGEYYHVHYSYNPYITDENGHWYVCEECGVTTDPEPHWVGCWIEDNTHCVYCGAECEPVHDWRVTSETEVTCTTDGVVESTCSVCGETKTETTAALGHNYEYVFEPGPSCDVPGITGEICSNCGDALWSAEVYHPNYYGQYTGYDETHHWGDCPDCGERMIEEAHENTCRYTDTCWLCDAPYSSGKITHLKYGSTPYITDENGHWYVCDECGVTTDPEPHWIGCWNEDNTHCLDCGVECEPNHNWEVTSQTEGTCTTDGVTVYTCSSCDETKTEIETAPGHAMSDPVTVDPTCTEDGSNTATCSTCGEEVVETIPATGHSFEDGGKTEPTCTEEGYQRGVCVTCGETLDEPIPATGHTWEETERLDASCETNGYVIYTCSACGETKEETLYHTGHNWHILTVTKQPTCTERGLEYRHCSNCDWGGNTTLASLGHDMVAQDNGDQVCSRCGYLEAAPVVEEPVEEDPVAEEPAEEPVEEPVTEIVIGESAPVAAVTVAAVIETKPDEEPVNDTITLMVYEPVESVAEMLPETVQENVETVYVVELLEDGVAIQPSGLLRLKIQLAEDADLAGQVLMLVAEDGTLIEIAYEVIDGCIVFETESIGVFVLVNAAE